MELVTFDGNPSRWPQFMKNFKIMAHLKTKFSENSNGETAWRIER